MFGAIIFGGMHVGRTGSNAPDFTKGRRAASRLFSLIERKPAIDAKTEDGEKLVRAFRPDPVAVKLCQAHF